MSVTNVPEVSVFKSTSKLLDPTIPSTVVFIRVLIFGRCILILFQSITEILLPNISANFSALSYVLLASIIFGVPCAKSEYIIDLAAPPAPSTIAGPTLALHSSAEFSKLSINPVPSVLSA